MLLSWLVMLLPYLLHYTLICLAAGTNYKIRVVLNTGWYTWFKCVFVVPEGEPCLPLNSSWVPLLLMGWVLAPCCFSNSPEKPMKTDQDNEIYATNTYRPTNRHRKDPQIQQNEQILICKPPHFHTEIDDNCLPFLIRLQNIFSHLQGNLDVH